MFRRAFIAALLAATPSLAQPVAAPDCTVDGRLADSDGLKLDITYRCRATPAAVLPPGRGPHLVLRRRISGSSSATAWPRRVTASISRASPAPSIRRRWPCSAAMACSPPWAAGCSSRGLRSRSDHRHPHDDGRRAWCSRPACPRWAMPGGSPARRCAPPAIRRWDASSLSRARRARARAPAPGRAQGGRRAAVAILDGVGESARADLFDWVERTAEAESNYWQASRPSRCWSAWCRSPHRRGVGYGRTEPGGGVTVMVEVGDRRRLAPPVQRLGAGPRADPYRHALHPRPRHLVHGRRGDLRRADHPRPRRLEDRGRGVARVGRQHAARRRRLRARPGQRSGRRELLGRRDLHAAGRSRHPPRQRRRQGAGGLPGRRAVGGLDGAQRVSIDDYAAGLRPRDRHQVDERRWSTAFQQRRSRSISPRCGRISASRWSAAGSCSTTARRGASGAR